MNKKTTFMHSLLLAVMALVMTSCLSNKDFILLQGAHDTYAVPRSIEQAYDLRIQPNDELAISVSSKNEELIQPFINTRLIGSTSTNGNSQGASATMSYILVDKQGKIDFPVFGKFTAVGKTCKQLAQEIQNRFVSENYILDALVTVKMASSKVTVLGEVSSPGAKEFSNERFTLLEALGKAGDITTSAKRRPVLVIREEDGQRVTYEVDLTDPKSVFNSPAYYMHQNDVVYVQPNRAARMKQSPGYTILTVCSTALSFLVSIVSLCITLTK